MLTSRHIIFEYTVAIFLKDIGIGRSRSRKVVGIGLGIYVGFYIIFYSGSPRRNSIII